MKRLLLYMVLFSTTALCQDAASSIDPCNEKPTSMMQMRDCADYEYRAADARLNRVYERALKYMSDDLGRARKRNDQAQAQYELAGIDGLRQAERVWLSYRDLQCKAAAQRYEGGTMAPLAYSNCLKSLTDHRVDDLKGVYEEGEQKLE